MAARQGTWGWLKDPARQEAARKAAVTRLDRERYVNVCIAKYEREFGSYPNGAEIRFYIEKSKTEIPGAS